MKKLILFLPFLLLLLSCSKDSESEQCYFVGKWCLWNPVLNSCSDPSFTFEFRSNGELYQTGTTFFNWESSDCKTVNVIHKASGAKSAEYIIRKQSNDIIYIDIGNGEQEYRRL